jgi:hypothetical protein
MPMSSRDAGWPILNLEGGVGADFLKGGLEVGLAYAAFVLSFVVGLGEPPPSLVAGELHRGRRVQ